MLRDSFRGPLPPRTNLSTSNHPENAMNITLSAGPLMALIAGILILIVPRLLNYIVALYLIIIGLLGLFGMSGVHTV